MGHLMLLFLVVTPMILVSQAGNVQKNYTVKISRDGKDYYEKITVDTRKGTETSKVTEASSGKDTGDAIYDFKRKLTMTRVPEAKSCFLSNSTENTPRPAELKRVLSLLKKYASVKISPQNEATYKVVGKLDDRSGLSQEMRDLCASLPIYRIAKGDPDQNDTADQMNDAELTLAEKPRDLKHRRGYCRKRCWNVCWRRCGWWGCKTYCANVCNTVC